MRDYPTLTVKRTESVAWSVGITDQNGTAVDLTGYTVSADLRAGGSFTLIDQLTCAITDAANGVVQVSATNIQTADWPLTVGSAYALMDLRAIKDGAVEITQTVEVVVQREVTLGAS